MPGIKDLKEVAKKILVRGVPDKIYVASDRRSIQAAFIIAASGPTSLVAAVQTPEEAWDTWRLGRLEGQPKKDVAQTIDELRLKTPWMVPIGTGKESKKFGESFNQFNSRVITRLWQLIAELQKKPKLRVFVITHDYVTSLIEAYLDMYGGRPEPIDSRYSLSVFKESLTNMASGKTLWVHNVDKGPIKFEKIELEETFPLTEAVIFGHRESD